MRSWYTIERSVTIINACHDHALYKQFGGGKRQELPYLRPMHRSRLVLTFVAYFLYVR